MTKEELLQEAYGLKDRTDLTELQKWNRSKSISISLRDMKNQTSHIRVIVEDKTDNTIKVIITPTTTEWLSSNPRALDIKHIVESKLDNKYRYVSHQVDYSPAIVLDLNLK
jgi:hypothetical protein